MRCKVPQRYTNFLEWTKDLRLFSVRQTIILRGFPTVPADTNAVADGGKWAFLPSALTRNVLKDVAEGVFSVRRGPRMSFFHYLCPHSF